MRETDNSENLEGTAASWWVFTWLIACLAWKPTVPARQYTAASQTDNKGSDVRDQRGSTAPEHKCTEETYFSENDFLKWTVQFTLVTSRQWMIPDVIFLPILLIAPQTQSFLCTDWFFFFDKAHISVTYVKCQRTKRQTCSEKNGKTILQKVVHVYCEI